MHQEQINKNYDNRDSYKDYVQGKDIRDKITVIQHWQSQLKKAILHVDVALKSPNMKYRQQILKEASEQRNKCYEQFTKQYIFLDHRARKVYYKMNLKFKSKIQQQIQQAGLNQEQHNQKLHDQKEVWFQNQEEQQSRKLYMIRGVAGLIGAFIIHLIIGAMARWGLINLYVSSYYKITSDPYIQTKYNAIGGPITLLFVGLTVKFGYHIANQYGKKKFLALCVFGLASSIFFSAFMSQFYLFLLLHNVLFGIFAGLAFVTPMKQCYVYFPGYKLMIKSFILCGTGMGAILFGIINMQCLNPSHQKANPSGYFSGNIDYIARKLPQCLFQMSFMMIIMGVVGCFLLYPLIQFNRKQEEAKLLKGQKQDFQFSCFSFQQAFKSLVFWIIFILIICSALGNYYMSANYRNFVKGSTNQYFNNQSYMIIVLWSNTFFNGISRMMWGVLFKFIGFKFSLLISLLLNLAVFASITSFQLNQYNYITLYIINGISLGCLKVAFPNACLLIYGDIIGQSIYGVYIVTFSLCGFIQYFWTSNINEIMAYLKGHGMSSIVPQNPYKLFYYFCTFLCMIGIFLCSLLKFQGRWQNSLKLLQLKCQ